MTMLAAVIESAGSTAVLELRQVEIPEPASGEVRVRITVAGVNPTDWKRLRTAGEVGDEFAVPTQDGAGVVDAVGEGVDPARIGERVWIFFAAWERQWGTAAEYSVVPADRAVRLPADASFELGASLGIPALTAWHCLRADGEIAGRPVLIAGGAGAVGHAAIELARFAGAYVAATVSNEEKAELARGAGAQTVVDYRDDADAAKQILAAVPGGVDRVVEVSLARNLELDVAVAAPHAVISSYADDGGGAASLPLRPLMVANLVLRFVLIYTVIPEQLADAVDGVSRAVAAGALTTLPLHRFPLERVADAYDAVEQGAVGKVILEVG
jgi:NADPH:quinone reductase